MSEDEEYVKMKDFKRLESKVDDIIDNHLNSIWGAIEFIFRDIGNLRWYIVGGVGIIAIVLTLLQVFG